jgi:hypothetical protein
VDIKGARRYPRPEPPESRTGDGAARDPARRAGVYGVVRTLRLVWVETVEGGGDFGYNTGSLQQACLQTSIHDSESDDDDEDVGKKKRTLKKDQRE